MLNVDITISGEPYAAKTSFVLNCSRALYVGIAKLSNIKAYRKHAASVLDDEPYPNPIPAVTPEEIVLCIREKTHGTAKVFNVKTSRIVYFTYALRDNAKHYAIAVYLFGPEALSAAYVEGPWRVRIRPALDDEVDNAKHNATAVYVRCPELLWCSAREGAPACLRSPSP